MSDIDVTEMGDAGKARPVPRGRYSDTETYDYLDFVYSGDASYIAKKMTTGNPPAENNEYWQLFARGGTLTENSDVSDTTVTFEQAENRANIFSKDSLKTIMGKISKMYSDLKTVAFSGKYTDLEGRVTVTNNDLATIPGTAWDAVRGAQIRKDLDKLNSDLSLKILRNDANAFIVRHGKIVIATIKNLYAHSYNFDLEFNNLPAAGIISAYAIMYDNDNNHNVITYFDGNVFVTYDPSIKQFVNDKLYGTIIWASRS